tara:strand:- start:285 stop:1130 length:846 start_codon:yes stop_codon:yes gene_type:complete
LDSILITGASGYIGRSFIRNFKNTYKINTFSLSRHSISDLDLNGVKTVIHCAAIVHQNRKRKFEEYKKINTDYPIILAKKAKKNRVKQFIFLSTLAVYDARLYEVNETSKCNPKTHYGISKYAAEKGLLKLNSECFNVCIIRLPMVYGKGAPGNMQKLIKLVQYCKILPFGGIDNKRSLLYIDNLCYALRKIIKKSMHGVFLISDDHPLSTSKIMALIASGLEKKIFLFKTPLLVKIIKIFLPIYYRKIFLDLEIKNQKTKLSLGLSSMISTSEGIKRMMD